MAIAMNADAATFERMLGLVALGLAPSAIWLWYFLKQDEHPEPKGMIMKVFVVGFCATFVAFGIEWAFIQTLLRWKISCPRCEEVIPRLLEIGALPAGAMLLPVAVLAVLAFIEEWMKFFSARLEIVRSRYFDEPIDAMIYLVVAALGFAGAENIGYVFQNAEYAAAIAYLRFLSSTFLHVLASAIVGYFFAISLIERTYRIARLCVGLFLATALHTVFNFFIITEENGGMLPLILLMLGTFLFVMYLFRRVRHFSFSQSQ